MPLNGNYKNLTADGSVCSMNSKALRQGEGPERFSVIKTAGKEIYFCNKKKRKRKVLPNRISDGAWSMDREIIASSLPGSSRSFILKRGNRLVFNRYFLLLNVYGNSENEDMGGGWNQFLHINMYLWWVVDWRLQHVSATSRGSVGSVESLNISAEHGNMSSKSPVVRQV